VLLFWVFCRFNQNMASNDIFKGKTVLVTGGTGSFGQRFVRKLLDTGSIKKVIVFSRDEFKQHQMQQAIPDPQRKLRFFLGDVRDLPRLNRALSGVDYVVHAAALKQVPALEYNPLEAIKTNVFGTQNVIEASLDNGIKKAVFVSTDKAVSPINLYGATKLCAEKLFVAANAYRKNTNATSFSLVRYGNVVGSRGSIVDILRAQRDKGAVILTDNRMTRFWITVDQGVQLVIDALGLMRGGEIFVPKLSAAKVADLISAFAPKATVRVVGIRPGEKLHETLLTEDEVRRARDIGKYYVVEPQSHEEWDNTHLKKHKFVSSDFRYASDSVKALTKKELLNILES